MLINFGEGGDLFEVFKLRFDKENHRTLNVEEKNNLNDYIILKGKCINQNTEYILKPKLFVDKFIIGRGHNCTIKINSNFVKEEHAKIIFDKENGWFIEQMEKNCFDTYILLKNLEEFEYQKDSDSSNDSKDSKNYKMKDGDLIRCCSTIFQVELSEE